MCDIRVIYYRGCRHQYDVEHLWCADARHRLPPAVCPHPERSLDVQDRVKGKCPPCLRAAGKWIER
ncbi:MAG: hypothetical protein M1826_005731 [Phylliscum demangeonii]|nr:MAG: hypothetical protein M1826_005731 [Phylliscum demangeonii]